MEFFFHLISCLLLQFALLTTYDVSFYCTRFLCKESTAVRDWLVKVRDDSVRIK
jgi:hypothetical protein